MWNVYWKRTEILRFWGIIGDLEFIHGSVLTIMRNLEMINYKKKKIIIMSLGKYCANEKTKAEYIVVSKYSQEFYFKTRKSKNGISMCLLWWLWRIIGCQGGGLQGCELSRVWVVQRWTKAYNAFLSPHHVAILGKSFVCSTTDNRTSVSYHLLCKLIHPWK